MKTALALVTDAYGGRGGVAQAARDIIGAIVSMDGIDRVKVLPRNLVDAQPALPQNVLQSEPRVGRISFALCALGQALRFRPALIFCNHLYMSPLAGLIARLSGAKLVIQLHGIECWSEPSFLQRKALEAADLLICVSRDTRRRILSHCNVDSDRAVVVNNTVDPCFTPGNSKRARERFGMENEFSLLAVGRLASDERYKGHDRVIEALAHIRAFNGRKVVFHICGTGEDRTRLEALALDIGVSDRVRFHGRVPFLELPDLYRAADLFALPSTGEGFGIVFLEAMACGTPALGLASGGAPDALGDGKLGHMVHPSADFVAALESAIAAERKNPISLANSIRERYGRDVFRARLSQVVHAFTLDRTCDDLSRWEND